MAEFQQRLELFISCRSLADIDTFSQSDPICILFVLENNIWCEYGRSEVIQNDLNPNFSSSFIIDYFFEVNQILKFEVHHFIDKLKTKLIGKCETSLGAIAGSKDQIFISNLILMNDTVRGKIIIKADQVKNSNDDIDIKLGASKIPDTRHMFWHCTSPFLRLYRLRKDDTTPVLVHQTEEIKNMLQPSWKPIKIKAQKLCNGDYLMPIKVELWDYRSSGKHIYLGETQFSIVELQQEGKNLKNRKIMDKKKNKDGGQLVIEYMQVIERPTFMDYIVGGTQLNLVLAIDFTASNQNPIQPTSLHYLDPCGKLNQYQQAILNVGQILVNYDYDKQIPVYGFGCKPKLPNLNSNQTLHCFPINGMIDHPEVYGIEGIMQSYSNFVNQCSFEGPTYFTPLLIETMKLATYSRDLKKENYYIMLILTDGEIHDMQTTIDAIIASSHLPLSIIIIGVGNADFKNMEKLDNDDLSMVDSKGQKAQRDLVQFVPFNQFKSNTELLAKNVLEELPNQLVDYFQLIKRKPNPPIQINLQNYQINTNNNIPTSIPSQYQNLPQQQTQQQQQYQQYQQKFLPGQQQYQSQQQSIFQQQQQQQYQQYQYQQQQQLQQQQQQQQQYNYQQQQQQPYKSGQGIQGIGQIKNGFQQSQTQQYSNYNYP